MRINEPFEKKLEKNSFFLNFLLHFKKIYDIIDSVDLSNKFVKKLEV